MESGQVKVNKIKDDLKIYHFPRTGNYQRIASLSEGSFGKVILVKKVREDGEMDQKIYALKISKRGQISKMDKEMSENETNFQEIREMFFMQKINHPHVIHSVDFQYANSQSWILMEYYTTNLSEYLEKSYVKLNERLLKIITFQILQGLENLHSSLIIHRDIKLENIFYDPEKEFAIVGDLGLARQIQFTPELQKLTLAGTSQYRPPEIVLGINYYHCSYDIWSLGCMIGAMVTNNYLFYPENVGKNVFGEENEKERGKMEQDLGMIKSFIKIFGRDGIEKVPGYENTTLGRLINCSNIELLFGKPIGLVNHLKKNRKFELSNEFYDIIEKMLRINLFERISATECLDHPWFKDLNIKQ